MSKAATPRYGIDAAGVMGGLLGAGTLGISFGIVLLFAWRSILGYCLGAAVMAIGLVPLVFGVAMAAYAVKGKMRVRDALLARRSWRGDEVVLDIGAGRGLMAIGAARLVPRGRVIAVDIWRQHDLTGNRPEALLHNAEIEGVSERIEVVTADARKLSLPDDSIDVVLSVLCLHNIEPAADQAAACRETARVLKPGGQAFIGDYIGTAGYAEAFRKLGLSVRGPINLMTTALGLMWVVEATKITRSPSAPPAIPSENAAGAPLPYSF
jgi:SAM-dependent methyltransferase